MIIFAFFLIAIPLSIVFYSHISNCETTTGKCTMAVFLISLCVTWVLGGHRFTTFQRYNTHPLGDTLSPLSYIPSICLAIFPTIICYAICKNIEDSKKEKEKENKKRQ